MAYANTSSRGLLGLPAPPHLSGSCQPRLGRARLGALTLAVCPEAALLTPRRGPQPHQPAASSLRRHCCGRSSRPSGSGSSLPSGFSLSSHPPARSRVAALGPAAASPGVSDSESPTAAVGASSDGPLTGDPAASATVGADGPHQQQDQQGTDSRNGHPGGAGAAGPAPQGQDMKPHTGSDTASVASAAGAATTAASPSTSTSASASSAPANEAAPPPSPVEAPQPRATTATLLDGLPDTQKYVLADEWGFSHVGADLPEGASAATFSTIFPSRFFAFDGRRAALALAAPLAAMAAGYGWLWYWHSICPLWQQLAAGVLIGTAYTGLFKVAHECARFAFLPQSPGLQEVLGAALMLPSLFPFPCWRLGFLDHLLHVNELGRDRFGWQPYTKLHLALDVVDGDGLGLALRRLALATPLKLLGSLGHWLRTFEGLDLTRFHPATYTGILWGWALPLLFAGLAIPAMIAAGGLSGFFSCYLFPWLVFHFWLSTLSLVQHTAPHIPWRAEDEGYDSGRATICGTVTLRLPRPLELLLNEANYGLPQMVAPGLPCYHARAAYEYMRERLLPYLTEAPLSLKLLTNHITKWQVYDEVKETYRSMEEVEEEVRRELKEVEEEMLAELRAAQEQEQQQDQEQEQGTQGEGPTLAVA